MGRQSRPVILLTRPRPAAERFARALRHALRRALAANPDQASGQASDQACDLGPLAPPRIVIAPLMEARPIEAPRPRLLGDAAAGPLVVFTSAAGVAGFARNWPEAAARAGLRALCVGPQTLRAARAAGFAAQIAPGGTAAALLAHLRAGPRGPVLVIRGREAAQDIAQALHTEGWQAEAAVVYAQDPRPLGDRARAVCAQGGPLILPLFSPRSAELAAAALLSAPACGLRVLDVVAISPATLCAAAPLAPRHALVAPSPDGQGMIRATVAAVTHLLSTGQNTT